MEHLEEIAERIHQSFEAKTAVRDQALSQTRTVIRYSANAIRAIHRNEHEKAQESLGEARNLVKVLRDNLLHEYPDLYYAGYTQDALKEFAEASITLSLIEGNGLPQPEELGLEFNTYLKGLAESVGEFRRRILDILLDGHSSEAERLLKGMDDIYAVLVTMDYPNAVTGGLRRLTDIVRSINERTRGDLVLSTRQQHLEESLKHVEAQLDKLSL